MEAVDPATLADLIRQIRSTGAWICLAIYIGAIIAS